MPLAGDALQQRLDRRLLVLQAPGLDRRAVGVHRESKCRRAAIAGELAQHGGQLGSAETAASQLDRHRQAEEPVLAQQGDVGADIVAGPPRNEHPPRQSEGRFPAKIARQSSEVFVFKVWTDMIISLPNSQEAK